MKTLNLKTIAVVLVLAIVLALTAGGLFMPETSASTFSPTITTPNGDAVENYGSVTLNGNTITIVGKAGVGFTYTITVPNVGTKTDTVAGDPVNSQTITYTVDAGIAIGTVGVTVAYNSAAAAVFTATTVSPASGGGSFPAGASVTVTAPATHPTNGAVFTGWEASGATVSIPNTASASFTMPASNVTITPKYGTATIANISVGVSPSGAANVTTSATTYNIGTGQTATFTATATSGDSTFSHWQIGGSSFSQNPLTINCDDYRGNPDIHAIAYYSDARHKVTVQDSTGGEATASAEYAAAGSSVKFEADPDSGYVFDRWYISPSNFPYSGDVNLNSSSIIITMPDGPVGVNAIFSKSGGEQTTTYVLTLDADPGGSITQGNSGRYAYGQDISISAVASEGFIFSGWEISGGTIADEAASSTEFTMPAKDTAIVAKFVEDGTATDTEPGESFPITTGTITNGQVTINPPSAAEGTTVNVQAIPDEGYQFVTWSSAEGVAFLNPNEATTTFTMPSGGATINATFEEAEAESSGLTWLWVLLAILAILGIAGGIIAFILGKKKSKNDDENMYGAYGSGYDNYGSQGGGYGGYGSNTGTIPNNNGYGAYGQGQGARARNRNTQTIEDPYGYSEQPQDQYPTDQQDQYGNQYDDPYANQYQEGDDQQYDQDGQYDDQNYSDEYTEQYQQDGYSEQYDDGQEGGYTGYDGYDDEE